MGCFVKPFPALEAGQTEIHTDIQFVPVTGKDVAICGHGSLAAAKAILSSPEYKEKGIQAIHFRTVNNRGVITVRVIGELLEVELPASPPVPVSREVKERISSIIDRAFGREVKINSVSEGGESFKHMVLVEVDKSEKLGESKVNKAVFADSGYPVNVVTSDSDSTEVFASRMFSPEVPGFEDHVCGSAHCLVVPYWYEKKGIQAGKEVVARMASERGGILNVNYDKERGKIRLAGEAALLATGVCYF
ncbi:hypothetical protein NMY22_g15138 [Coprinellus aureogranulatus]|nr:hypothetical protein NMY22_g15138 [Coprinellus aureogranulatus]